MTVIPTKPTPLAARTDADFAQEFVRYADAGMTTPVSLAGWSFRFAVKKSALDDDVVLEATSVAGVTVLDEGGGRLRVAFDRDALLAGIPDGVERFEGVYALQATGPSDADEVWAAGPFSLIRGV